MVPLRRGPRSVRRPHDQRPVVAERSPGGPALSHRLDLPKARVSQKGTFLEPTSNRPSLHLVFGAPAIPLSW
jgi:hypothetical protein